MSQSGNDLHLLTSFDGGLRAVYDYFVDKVKAYDEDFTQTARLAVFDDSKRLNAAYKKGQAAAAEAMLRDLCKACNIEMKRG